MVNIKKLTQRSVLCVRFNSILLLSGKPFPHIKVKG